MVFDDQGVPIRGGSNDASLSGSRSLGSLRSLLPSALTGSGHVRIELETRKRDILVMHSVLSEETASLVECNIGEFSASADIFSHPEGTDIPMMPIPSAGLVDGRSTQR